MEVDDDSRNKSQDDLIHWLLPPQVCGLVFVGADAGGFFGDPDAELMARWIQAAAYTPFFRGHAHHDAKRREPWSFGEPTTAYICRAIADRYALLPYWYSVESCVEINQ